MTPTTPIPGDFDKDSDVDGDDLILWKGAFGQTAVGDADSDGDSDGADFLVWQRNYAPGAATGATAAIPEPAAAALAARMFLVMATAASPWRSAAAMAALA